MKQYDILKFAPLAGITVATYIILSKVPVF